MRQPALAAAVRRDKWVPVDQVDLPAGIAQRYGTLTGHLGLRRKTELVGSLEGYTLARQQRLAQRHTHLDVLPGRIFDLLAVFPPQAGEGEQIVICE